MEIIQTLSSIQADLDQIKKALAKFSSSSTVTDKWVSRAEVMLFLNYAPTQMAALENSGKLIVAKVGKRKFILRESLERLLDSNILSSAITSDFKS